MKIEKLIILSLLLLLNVEIFSQCNQALGFSLNIVKKTISNPNRQIKSPNDNINICTSSNYLLNKTRQNDNYFLKEKLSFTEYGNRKTVYSYDKYNNLIESLEQYLEYDWVNTSRELYRYDSNDNNTEFIFQIYENERWVNVFMKTYEYDSSAKMINEIHLQWDEIEWRKYFKITYSYNERGSVIEQLEQEIDNNKWIDDERYLYKYYEDGKLSETIRQRWNDTKWKNIRWDSTNYFNQLTEITGGGWAGESKYISRKEIYKYDTNNNLIEFSQSSLHLNNWVDAIRKLYIYDPNNNLIESITQRYVSGWHNEYRELYDYDSNDNLIDLQYQKWKPLSNDWESYLKDIYSYFKVWNVKIENIVKKHNLANNYPNPFNLETKIKYSLLEKSIIVLEIFDVLGNKVRELINDELGKGEYEFLFDASNLSSGTYFYRLRVGKFTETKKMILLK